MSLDAVFIAAVDRIFAIAGKDADYYPAGWMPDGASHTPISCRVIEILDVAALPGIYESGVDAGRRFYAVRRSQIPTPRQGDALTVEGVSYKVDGMIALRSNPYEWALAVR